MKLLRWMDERGILVCGNSLCPLECMGDEHEAAQKVDDACGSEPAHLGVKKERRELAGASWAGLASDFFEVGML